MDSELDRLGERIAEQAAHLDAAMYQLLVDLREFDERGGWYAQGALSCAHWLSWRVGWTLATARDRVRVANKLPAVPAISDALRRGEVSYSKVRAMVRIATPANEALLLGYARFMTASQLEETCRKYALVLRHGQDPHPLGDLQRRYVRRRDTEDGMVKIEAVVHPEEAELIWTMLTHAAGQLVHSPDSSTHDELTSNPVSAETVRPVLDATSICNDAHARVVSAETQPLASKLRSSDHSGGEHPQSERLQSERLQSERLQSERLQSEQLQSERLQSERLQGERLQGERLQSERLQSERLQSERLQSHILQTGVRQSGEAGHPVGEPDQSPDGNSRLDRLLDEAEGPRVAEATSEDTAQPIGTDPRIARPASELRRRADAVQRAFSRADALVSLAQGYLRGNRRNRAPIEVVLTIPASSLRTGGSQLGGGSQPASDAQRVDGSQSIGGLQAASALHAVEVGEFGESFVSCEAARRLSCDSGVVEVVENDHGVPLSVGRKRRTMSGQLKRALLERDKMCTFPGCTNRLYLEGHHIKHWADGGETSLRNGCLLCSLCRARHKEHYAAYRVMPRSCPHPVGGGVLYAA
jgi:hypothetical protein